MPKYEYFCEVCQSEFEAEHSITTELEECPICKEDNIHSKPKRLISKSSFILQGGGWAKEGYK